MKLPEFQRYPMWMKHPDGTDTMNPPVMVNNDSQRIQYLAKGYIEPFMDEEFFSQEIVRRHLSNQLVAIILSQQKYAEQMRTFMYALNKFECKFDDAVRDAKEEFKKDYQEQKNSVPHHYYYIPPEQPKPPEPQKKQGFFNKLFQTIWNKL